MAYLVACDPKTGRAYSQCPHCRQSVVLVRSRDSLLRIAPHGLPEPPVQDPPLWIKGDKCEGGALSIGLVDDAA